MTGQEITVVAATAATIAVITYCTIAKLDPWWERFKKAWRESGGDR